ncbi:MAG: Fe2+-dependent dioxygenase [Acidiferrobacterales bacterium]
MIITIPHLLPDTITDQIVADLNSLEWRAGETDDAEYAALVKRNLELKEQDNPIVAQYGKLVLEAILTNAELRGKALPHKAKIPQFNKYTDGGFYERHGDSAFMGKPEIRTDLAVTVFLNDPDEYVGGELTLEYPSGEVRQIKPKKGTLVCYPSDVLHHVTPVTDGARYAAITWIQSIIRAPHQRNLLASVIALSNRIKATDGVNETYAELVCIQNNLLKMWAEF